MADELKQCGNCTNYWRCPVDPKCTFAERCALYFDKQKLKKKKKGNNKNDG